MLRMVIDHGGVVVVIVVDSMRILKPNVILEHLKINKYQIEYWKSKRRFWYNVFKFYLFPKINVL
jgi:hypothetical protein